MALFTKIPNYPRYNVNRSPRRRPVVLENPGGLPGFMKELDVVCRRTEAHPIPAKMKFIGAGVSDRGQPMAVYACPFPGCQWREGWVQDRRTRKPFRLWAGFHRGR